MVAISVWTLTAYRRVDINRPSSSLNSLARGGETVESLTRETAPPCRISFPLPLFLFYSPSTRWTTRRNGVLSNCHTSTSSCQKSLSYAYTPSFENLFPNGVVSRHQPKCLLPWSQLQRRERQWEGLPEEANAIGDLRKKTTETETHSSLATVYACTVNPRQILDTNQSD